MHLKLPNFGMLVPSELSHGQMQSEVTKTTLETVDHDGGSSLEDKTCNNSINFGYSACKKYYMCEWKGINMYNKYYETDIYSNLLMATSNKLYTTNYNVKKNISCYI